jgi:hypothetical protein
MTSSLSDSIAKAKADASVFVKVEANKAVRLHIISKAKMFGNIYFDTPPYEGAPKSMNVPYGTQIPGYKIRPQWTFAVVNMESGAHKILCVGTSVVEAIDKADQAFRPKASKTVEGAGYPLLDIVLSKTGEKLATKWTVTPAPTEYEGDGIPTVDMDSEIVMASAEQLAKLGATKPKSPLVEGSRGKPSDKQVDLIDSLCKSKELTVKALNDLILRKFGKNALSECSMSDASVLIETLQSM